MRFSDTVFSVLMLPLPAVKCLGSWIAPGKEAAAETHATRCAQCCYMLLHVSNQQTNQGTPLSKSQQANIHTQEEFHRGVTNPCALCLPPVRGMDWLAMHMSFRLCYFFVLGFCGFCQARPAPYSSCLDDAIPEATWKVLVSPAGESYPIGMWVNDWAAGHLAAAVAQILIQERKCFMFLPTQVFFVTI